MHQAPWRSANKARKQMKNFFSRILFALFALMSLFAGGTGIAMAVTMSPCQAQPVREATNERDFYQILLEEKTPDGKTAVVAKDSEGQLHFGEFQEPLGVKKVLVIGKGRFRPLFPQEQEKKAPTKTGN